MFHRNSPNINQDNQIKIANIIATNGKEMNFHFTMKI